MNLLKRCIRYSLAHTINSLPSCIQDKIFTHSLSGLSIYSKQFLLNKYESNCQIINCYICNWCGIFNLQTDVYIHAQTLCFIVFIIYVLIKMRCFSFLILYIFITMCINNNWCYSFGGPCDSDQMVLAGVSRSTFYNYYSSWNIYFVQYYVVQINEFLILILVPFLCQIAHCHVGLISRRVSRGEISASDYTPAEWCVCNFCNSPADRKSHIIHCRWATKDEPFELNVSNINMIVKMLQCMNTT